jgi:DUF2939 family protein
VTSKALKAAIIAAVLAVAAYWYWSPHLAVRAMKAAAEAKDADAFNGYVDYPKLRESLKGQFSSRMTEALGAGRSGSDAGQAGMALGAMLGMAMVDKVIEAMVRPELVMKAMSEAKLQDPTARRTDGPANKPQDMKWVFDRKGVDRFVAYGVDPSKAGPKEEGVGFVFDRSGFANWKMTEIRLPTKP